MHDEFKANEWIVRMNMHDGMLEKEESLRRTLRESKKCVDELRILYHNYKIKGIVDKCKKYKKRVHKAETEMYKIREELKVIGDSIDKNYDLAENIRRDMFKKNDIFFSVNNKNKKNKKRFKKL